MFFSFDHLATGNSLAAAQKAICAGGDFGLHSMGTYDGTDRGIVASGGRNWVRVAPLNVADSWIKCLSDHATLVGVGVLTKQPSSTGAGASSPLIRIVSSTDQNLVEIVNRTDSNTLCNIRARNGVVVGQIDIPRGVETYVELLAKIADSAIGWIVVRVDGGATAETIITGEQTKVVGHGDAHTALFSAAANGGGNRADFTYGYTKELDDDPNAPNATGPIEMETDFPTADVTAAWPRTGAASNAAAVATDDGDTSYCETGTSALKDRLSMGSIAPGVNSFITVIAGSLARAPNGGAPTIQHSLELSGNEDFGAALPIGTTAYRTCGHSFGPLAPDGAAWTESKYNSLIYGRIS